ncbi:Nucleoside ABC transporter, permease protein 1 [Paenibacillus pasadenensis]|uniref:Nucleoside ABC transporter, permease protein 1 n=1 Tax=Paenibacillus pasadenensis TaxID=217090 RepID=A0A2N5NAT3_9BACL|nr:ABC transporter permease [Paenibacillus pasadenensis]PLT47467.1 Nucleoside ABC transporter, permease protein 1 [Paenibacillus pasadenensis]
MNPTSGPAGLEAVLAPARQAAQASASLAGGAPGSPAAAASTPGAARKPRFPLRFELDPAGKGSPWWTPIVSVVAALLICAVFIAANGMNPLTVYAKMMNGAFGSSFGLTETLVKAIPLLLCGLGVSIAYRISVWNIGAEGQLLAGAMGATAITIYLPGLSLWLTIPAMLLAGIAAGALWGLFTAIPRTYFQVNELITSLMLNYIALLALNYFVFGPWKDPKGFNFPGTPMFGDNQMLPVLGDTRLHLGLVFAVGAVALYAVLIRYTRWGYELRLIGANPDAARGAGINIRKHILIVMAVSGGLAGIAGMAEVAGVSHRLMYGISPGYGYTAIIVAWLAKLHPAGLLVTSFLFGGLIVGGYSVQTIGMPSSISSMIQGAILFCLIAGDMAARFRIRRAA